VYESLVVQTRLLPYLNSIGLVVTDTTNHTSNDTGIQFDTAGLAARVDAGRSAGNREVLIDLIELNRYAQGTLRAVQFDGLGRLRSWMDSLPSGSPLHATLAELRVGTLGSGEGSAESDILFGSAAADSISAGRGNDIVVGDAGLGEGQIWAPGVAYSYMRRVGDCAAAGSRETTPARPVPYTPFKMNTKRHELHTTSVGS
jgi:hypothetical protein